ncbi:MAG: hypothetical protein ABI353_20385 [Isosphaeraceae bacterium]
MIEIEETDQTRAIVTRDVRLRFYWNGDRWTHALEIGPERSVFTESVEGDPARDDPARVVSPAYQELHFQTDGPKTMALLVGRSGPHHFSAVFTVQEFEAEDAQAGRRVVVEVDLADRCRSPMTALACTYLVHAAPENLLHGGSDGATWRSEVPSPEFAHLGVERSRLTMAESGRRGTLAQIDAALDPDQATQRFLYLWQFDQSPRLSLR